MRQSDALPITHESILRAIDAFKQECNKSYTYEEAECELNRMADKGCLMYEDCRSCRLFDNCPLVFDD